jgi:hypothetical protein
MSKSLMFLLMHAGAPVVHRGHQIFAVLDTQVDLSAVIVFRQAVMRVAPVLRTRMLAALLAGSRQVQSDRTQRPSRACVFPLADAHI